jgi:hypothetical protein
MSEHAATAKIVTAEELVSLRAKTDHIAHHFQGQFQGYLETLRPLFSPRRLLGRFVGAKEDVPGSDRALTRLREEFKAVCQQPFDLLPDLDSSDLAFLDNRVELYPWEYSHTAKTETESKAVTITSPLRWVLSHGSGYTLPQVRQVLAKTHERRTETVREFVTAALVTRLIFERFPGIAALLSDLRYEARIEKCPGLGDLAMVTITSHVPSFRPPDDAVLMATRLSGVPAFIELVDVKAVPTLEDPLRKRIEELLR